MALTREAVILPQGYRIGDIKPANYDISFTLNQLVEPETGWFLLNGSVVSQTTYPILYARFGGTFNTGGEGAGNFRLPNHTEGAFPIAAGLTNFATYGGSGGEITHVLTTAQLASHNHPDTKTFSGTSHSHTGSLSAANDGGHTHSYTLSAPSLTSHGGGVTVSTGTGSGTSGAGGASHSHTMASLSFGAPTSYTWVKSGSITNAGSGGAHNNMMPYIVIGGLLVRHD
jgi:microcystin-dependent protein